MLDDGRAIFLQIAQSIEDAILDGSLAPESQAPSSNELAAFHRINPATAAKGLNLLVEKGVLHKRRGIGMFVSADAAQTLLAERRAAFGESFLDPLLAEAGSIGLSRDDVIDLLRSRSPTIHTEGRP